MSARFVAQTPFQAGHPNALAIYCSDGRFTRAVEELLSELGHERLDTLTMPGGPALLNLWSSSYTQSDAMERSSSFLIQAHAIDQVVLLAHQGCGYYKAQYKKQTPEEIHARQLEDLQVAARSLKKGARMIEVAAFYCRTDNQRILFDPVELK